MADVEYSRRPPPQPRDLLSRRPIPDDYRPPHFRDVEPQVFETANDVDPPVHGSGGMNASVNLRKLEEQLTRRPLDQIATLVQGLTYGEMIELAEAVWKSQPEGSAITQDNLSLLMHRWSKSRTASTREVTGQASAE
jgi:hypothetical protein